MMLLAERICFLALASKQEKRSLSQFVWFLRALSEVNQKRRVKSESWTSVERPAF